MHPTFLNLFLLVVFQLPHVTSLCGALFLNTTSPDPHFIHPVRRNSKDTTEWLESTVVTMTSNNDNCHSEWVSTFLMAQQHNLGHLVPVRVKNEERESNHKTKLQRLTRIHWQEKLYNQGFELRYNGIRNVIHNGKKLISLIKSTLSWLMTAITNDITVMPVLKNTYIACGQFITFSCFGLELVFDRLKSTDFTHQLHISCFTLVQLLLEALDLFLLLLSFGLQALYTLHEDNKHLQYLDLNYHYQTSVESTYVHNKLLIYVKLCIFMHKTPTSELRKKHMLP